MNGDVKHFATAYAGERVVRAADSCDLPPVTLKSTDQSCAVDLRSRRHSKMLLATSSMLRCTSASSVSAQTTPTWHARRGGIPCAISFPV
jgi:hypothetical protein